MSHRAPPESRDAGGRLVPVHQEIGDVISQIGGPFDGGLIDTILNHGVFERGVYHERLADNILPPGHGVAGRIQAGVEKVQGRGPIVAAANVIFTGPDHFDRSLDDFGDLHCFPDKMAVKDAPAAEAAAQQRRMDFDLFRFQAGDFDRGLMIGGLELGTGPDIAAVRADVGEAVEGFHGGVGEIWQFVNRIESGRGLSQGGSNIALLPGDGAGKIGKFSILPALLFTVKSGQRTFIPIDLQGLATSFGGPKTIGHHRQAAINLHNLADPETANALSAAKLLTWPPKTGGRAMRAVSIPGTLTSRP